MTHSIKQRLRRAGAVILATTLLVATMTACGGGNSGRDGASSSGDSGRAVKVSIIADLTGAFSTIQGAGLNGALTAIDAINAAGGIGGTSKIDIVGTYDAGSGGDQTQTAARSALADDPDAILVFAGSASSVTLFPLLSTSEVPVLSNYEIDSMAFPSTNWWGFNSGTNQSAEFAFARIKDILGDNLEGKRIAYEVIDSPGVEAAHKPIRDELEAMGTETVADEVVPAGVTTFATQAAKIAALDPDLVVTHDGAANAQVVVKALLDAGYDGPVVGVADGQNSDALFTALKTPNFSSGRNFTVASEGTKLADLAKTYGHDSSGSFFTSGFVIANVLADAFENCTSDCDHAALTSAIEGLGEWTAPEDSAYGPLLFEPGLRIPIYSNQFVAWDSSGNEIAPVGDLIQIKATPRE